MAGDGVDLLQPDMLEDAANRAREALDGALRIKKVSRSLNSFSRLDRQELSQVNANSAVESALKMASNEIKYRAQLVKELGPVPDVWASEGQLAQVFLNLLVNATHAIDEGHAEDNTIKVRTWAEGDSVFAEVIDTGTGIPQQNLQRIFEPFFTTKDIGKGSGLGLSTCRNIVNAFGGDIRVESEVGKGTRVVVRLPTKPKGSASVPAAEVSRGPSTSLVRGRVLVVDDDGAVCKTIMRAFEHDHDVVSAASGKEGRAILERDQEFDVVLCDMMMSDISGVELHSWLREEHPVLASRTVFITGGAFTPKAAAYLASVSNLRVDKPFDTVDLTKIVSEMIVAAKNGR